MMNMRHFLNRQQGINRTTFILLLLMLTLLPLNASGGVMQGEYQSPVTVVEVTLTGVNQYGTVQIFDQLIDMVPGVTTARQVSQRIDPAHAKGSFATWQVSIIGGNGFHIERELHKLIEVLDQQNIDDILNNNSFIVMEQDIFLLKQVEPVYAVTKAISYALVNPALNAEIPSAYSYRPTLHTNNPWLSVPGAGFE